MTPQEPSQDIHEQRRELDGRLAGGVAWTAGAKWATQFVTWASVVALGHLLSPADFGISEMAGIYFILTNMLAEFGVGTAVLHMPELDRSALGQLHAFSVLLCTLVFGLSVLAAPLVAGFYHTPLLTAVIVVANLSFFITGFQAVPLGLLQRDMDFRRLSLSEAAQSLVQAAVSVLCAWVGLGYWSLIIGGNAGKLTNAAMVSHWKRVPFGWPRWKDIRAPIELGRQAAIGRLAWSTFNYADGVTVGRVLGDSMLGYYRMAMTLASAPADKVSALLMRTAGPLFANVQNDLALVRRYYLIFAEALSLTIMPLMAGLVMVAPMAVTVVLGSKWDRAIMPMQFLAVFMIVRVMESLADQILISQRATRFTMRMALMNLCVMPVAFYVAAKHFGMTGVAAAWIVMCPATILPSQIVLVRRIKVRLRDLGATLWPAFFGSAVMALGLRGLQLWLAGTTWAPIVRLIAEIASGAVIYGVVMLVLFRGRLLRYVNFVRDLRSRRESKESPAEPSLT